MFRLTIHLYNHREQVVFAQMFFDLQVIVNRLVGDPNVKSFDVHYSKDITIDDMNEEPGEEES